MAIPVIRTHGLVASQGRQHRPASHPVLRRLPSPQPREVPAALVGPEGVRAYGEAIDLIARLVAHLTRQPATVEQARSLSILAAELLRRAE